jgi:uncharacterized protein (DUF1778 family)
MTQAQEPVTISIRAKAGQRDLIDQAADRLGRSRSDFMLEAACKQAEDVLLDQTYFALDAKSFAAFQDDARQTTSADRPPAPHPQGPGAMGNETGQNRSYRQSHRPTREVTLRRCFRRRSRWPTTTSSPTSTVASPRWTTG